DPGRLHLPGRARFRRVRHRRGDRGHHGHFHDGDLALLRAAEPQGGAAVSAVRMRNRAASVLLSAVAVVVFAFSVFPVYWMIQPSFQPNNEIIGSEVNFWPETFTLRNYETVLFATDRAQFLPALGNSLIITVATVVIALVFAFLA